MVKQGLVRGAWAALLLGFVALIGGVACVSGVESSLLDMDPEFSSLDDGDSLDTGENPDSDTGPADTTIEDSEGTDTSTEEEAGTDSADGKDTDPGDTDLVVDTDTVDTATDMGPPADPSCESIGGVSFGSCGELLGFAIRAKKCIPIDGCLDPAPSEIGFFSTLEACEAACTGCSSNEDCLTGEICDFPPQSDCGRLMTGSCIIPSGYCIAMSVDVCGCDGMIYSSLCQAHSNGVSEADIGYCE